MLLVEILMLYHCIYYGLHDNFSGFFQLLTRHNLQLELDYIAEENSEKYSGLRNFVSNFVLILIRTSSLYPYLLLCNNRVVAGGLCTVAPLVFWLLRDRGCI